MSRPESPRPSLGDRLDRLLWEAEDLGPVGRVTRVVLVTGWKFAADRGFLRASALTYATLLSLVPLLAIMFSVLKGLGVQRRLEPLLLEHITAGNTELTARILEYVNRTEVGTLGAVGLAMLVFTVISVLNNIEGSFNDIWQVRQGRSMVRKVADYLSVLVVSPLLLFLSLSLTTSLQSETVLARLDLLGPVVRHGRRGLPFLAVWLAFAAMYTVMPNRRVPWRSALLGGVVAGSVWLVAEWAYIRFQFGVARYNAIYGAMAQLPMLLVWVYTSWCIVLFGAELAFVHQAPGRGRYLRSRHRLWVPRADVGLNILLAVARRFERGEPAPTAGEVVDALRLDPADGERVVNRLLDDGVLVATADDPPGLVPARAPGRTPAAELVLRVARLGDGGQEGTGGAPVARLRAAVERELAGITWADLAVGEDCR